MQKSQKIFGAPAALIGLANLIAGEFPTAIIAFGVLANFAWVAGAFWILSYWIAWHWA